MDYRKFGNTIIARIDRGEEILEQVKQLAHKEQYQARKHPGAWRR